MKKAVQVVLDERLIEAADTEVRSNPALSTRSQLIASLLVPYLPENIHKRISRTGERGAVGGKGEEG